MTRSNPPNPGCSPLLPRTEKIIRRRFKWAYASAPVSAVALTEWSGVPLDDRPNFDAFREDVQSHQQQDVCTGYLPAPMSTLA